MLLVVFHVANDNIGCKCIAANTNANVEGTVLRGTRKCHLKTNRLWPSIILKQKFAQGNSSWIMETFLVRHSYIHDRPYEN